MYELVTIDVGPEGEPDLRTSIRRTSDGASIPADPENLDYQAYLAWVEEGNVPAEIGP